MNSGVVFSFRLFSVSMSKGAKKQKGGRSLPDSFAFSMPQQSLVQALRNSTLFQMRYFTFNVTSMLPRVALEYGQT